MNPLDKWCRHLALAAAAALGLEGLAFAHQALHQARLIESPALALAERSHSTIGPRQRLELNPVRVAVNGL